MTVQKGTQLGRYRLDALLGVGGMAEVWKATLVGPAGFDRTVVVKRVLSHLGRDEAFVKMFLAEARLCGRLSHPNIVQVFELGQDGAEFYMAMEYVAGCDVGVLLKRGVAIPVGAAVFITQSVCRALAHAHGLCATDGTPLGIVHRDVTPSNIMLGREGSVKLLDFGIAKALGATETRTETGTLKGKIGYMAPEHVDGQPLDARSDVFAVGVVLHEMLTGKRLFKGASDFLTLSMMRAANVTPPAQLNPAVPLALDATCLRALAREPGARFASADDMADALEPFVDGWNAERLRRLLDEHLSEQTDDHDRAVVTLTAEPPVPATARARGIRWRLALTAACVVGIAGIVTYRVMSPAEAPAVSPSVAPAPALMPPTTAENQRAPAPANAVIPAPAETVTPPTVTPTTSRKKRPERRTEPRPTKREKPVTKAKPDFDPESALP